MSENTFDEAVEEGAEETADESEVKEVPEPIQDLETIDAALAAIENDEVAEASEAFADARVIVQKAIDGVEEEGDTEEHEMLHQQLQMGDEALEALENDDYTPEERETAVEILETIGEQIQMVVLEAMLEGAAEGGVPDDF